MIDIPGGALEILGRLNDAGYDAYVVGGCVRDSLRGIAPYDWDITTSATPDEMKEVFLGEKIIETGIKHGTLTIRSSAGEFFEVTTFRVDGEYKDGRHPENVEFVRDVEGDLARRDFTMKAIACDAEGNTEDPFGGEKDISNEVIRCVGDPDKRFGEDGLRILRALRFAAATGFAVEEKTRASIHRNAGLLSNISAERINSELTKLLLGDHAFDVLMEYKDIVTAIIPELAPSIGFEQNSVWHCYDVYEHIMRAVDAYKGDDACIKFALLLHDVGKPACYSVGPDGRGHFYGHVEESVRLAGPILDRLKFSNADKEKITELIRYHDIRVEPQDKSCRKALGKLGLELMEDLGHVKKADISAQSEYSRIREFDKVDEVLKIARKIASSGACLKLRDLAVGGDDLIEELGVAPGPVVGNILNELLKKVIEDQIPNERGALLECARDLYANGVPND